MKKTTKPSEYTFEAVQKALDATPDMMVEVGKEIGRTKDAISTLRWQARQFQKGEVKYVSQPLQEHFRTYFTNKGNMQLEAQAPTEPKPMAEAPTAPEETEVRSEAQASDVCEHTLEKLVKEAEDTFARMQMLMQQIAKVSVQHQNHSMKDELHALRKYKTENEENKLETEKELKNLRDFRDKAKKSNLGTMLRSVTPF